MRDATRYAIVAVAVYDMRCMWVEVWRTEGRTVAIELAQDLLDGGYACAAVVQGRGTPGAPTPPGETQIYQGIAGGYRADAFFPLTPREHIDQRPRLQGEWRPVWAAVPRDHPARAADIYDQVTWRRSYGQFLHALRQMRTAGLLTSPARGQYQRVRRQPTADAAPELRLP